MRLVKILIIIAVVYVGIVATFESLLGYFQPANDSTLVITTTNSDGDRSPRVVSAILHDEQLYVAANHWPRAWYNQALENPGVTVDFQGQIQDYTAVPVTDGEHDEVNGARPLGTVFRILTGFPPRYFLRLDPNPAE